MNIILAGSTGLVGGLLAARLYPARLTTIGRRANAALDPAVSQKVGAVAEWPGFVAAAKADVVVCCLGTTIKQAGSQAAFEAIDLDAVIAFAGAAKLVGARQFLLVSSVGAKAGSGNFYQSTKGKAEAGVIRLGFDRVDIFRPGLLRGARVGPNRPVESLMMSLSPFTDLLTPSRFASYRSTAAEDVAAAMAACIGRAEEGLHVHENAEIQRLLGE
jgi:uncharacterized protein YbjT (DUF2867 family)